MKLINLQTITVLVILVIFCVWSLATIIDDFTGNKGVVVPDQFWALLATAVGALLYALKYSNGNGKNKEAPK